MSKDPCSPVPRTDHPGSVDSTLVVRERDGYAPGFAAQWHMQGGRLIFPTQLERRRRASIQWIDVKRSVEKALGASHGARVTPVDHESFAVAFDGSCAAFLGALSQVPIVRNAGESQ